MRSGEMLSKIKSEVIDLLKTTKLSHTEIGKLFGVSRGPIHTIQKLHNIKRVNIRKNDSIPCKWCAEPIRHIKSKTRPNRFKYCNKECYRLWQKSDANKGANNPNWDETSKWHEKGINKLRKSEEWKAWRTSIYERDDYTCQSCFERGKQLHPHHILYKSEFPSLIFLIENGITLCKKCHDNVHFYDTVNKEQYKKKFLNTLGMSEASLMHMR